MDNKHTAKKAARKASMEGGSKFTLEKIFGECKSTMRRTKIICTIGYLNLKFPLISKIAHLAGVLNNW